MSLKMPVALRPCCFCGGTGKVEEIDTALLRAWRIAAGVSLRAMARRLHHSPAYVSHVERDKRRFPPTWWAYYAGLRAKRRHR